MPTPEDEIRKKKEVVTKKHEALAKILRKEDDGSFEDYADFIDRIQKVWALTPFLGEEEQGAGKSDFDIDGEQKVRGTPFDSVLWFTLFRMISDKLDKEFSWLRKNKETLEMMVKEYMAQGEHR